MKLRNKEIDKNEDGVYGWNSQQEFLKVKAELASGGGGRAEPKGKSGKDKGAKGKPGKKTAGKKTAPKKRTPRPEAEAA